MEHFAHPLCEILDIDESDGLQIGTFPEAKIVLRIQSSPWYTVKHQFGV